MASFEADALFGPQPPPLLDRSFGPGEVADVARAILAAAPQVRVFALWGELGTGKTTLVGALVRLLVPPDGLSAPVSSPTFALAQRYDGGPEPIHHLDLYRLRSTQEALEIGLLDYLDGPGYCFVEWPERIADYLRPPFAAITLQHLGPDLETELGAELRHVTLRLYL